MSVGSNADKSNRPTLPIDATSFNQSLVESSRSSIVVRTVITSSMLARPRRRTSDANARVGPPAHCTSSSTMTSGVRAEMRSRSTTSASSTAYWSTAGAAVLSLIPSRADSIGKMALRW